ncbi:MAG: NADH:flavin oxidoreductase [Verrucomicrobia bacterium]|nr:NADH:flavin oxidoreductase [Verrucomicrobiota bacterium]MDA1068880.1 NADH:flavin oxidoreductase [Verrucomicrobiota bacterium]
MSDSKSHNEDVLFRPFPFGRITLPNRIVMAPMTRNKSPGNVPGAEVAAYYRRRAEGGIGLIVTEGTHPGFKGAQGYPDVPNFHGTEALAGWKKVAAEVHQAGGFIIPQIWHVGSIRKKGIGSNPEDAVVGPSPVMHPFYLMDGELPEGAEVPEEMSQSDIDACVAAYANAAEDALENGFDGVEIHGAHSYLIDQFFWEATNRRVDSYGGNLAQRTRFAVEIIQAMRARVPDNFPIVFRFSQWKSGDYYHKMARSPEELESFLLPLSEAGVDIFHCSTRRFNDPEFKGSNLNLAGWTKRLTGKPSITVGSVGLDNDFLRTFGGQEANASDISALIGRMEESEFDLVAVGRALLSDPAWAQKIQTGREKEIVEFTREYMQKLA